MNYRTAWAKSYLKKHGLVDNTERGVWALTAEGQKTTEVDPGQVKATVRDEFAKKKRNADTETHDPDEEETPDVEESWKDRLLSILVEMSPDAFERLSQRLLRESGFNQVEVTGRSGDGGIDGHGVVKLQGLLSFHVYFQCKRYRNTVGSSVVRDFRGTMMGRADKDLIILWSRYRVDPREDFRVRGRLHDLREHVRITDDHWRFSGTRGSPTPAMLATRNVLRGHGLFNQWG